MQATSPTGVTPLMCAARNGKEAAARELLLRGAAFPTAVAINGVGYRQRSYQHRAAAIGALEKLPIDLQNIVLNQMGHQRMSEQERQALE